MGSKVCIIHIITGLLYFLCQPIPGESTGTNIAGWRYRRDAEDQYYDPSTRTGCPPSMTSGGGSSGTGGGSSGSGGGSSGSGGGSGSSASSIKTLVLVVDTTLSNGKAWNEFVNLLLKVRSYAKDAMVGVVSLNCRSEIILRLGQHSEDAIKKAISAQKPKSGKKTISEAFNLADVLISASGSSNRRFSRVVVLSDTVSDDCLSEKHDIDAFKIASRNWQASGVQVLFIATGKRTADMDKITNSVISLENSATVDRSVYQTVAKWACKGQSVGGSPVRPGGGGTTSSSSGTTQSSSGSATTQSSSSTSATTTTTSTTTSSTTSSTAPAAVGTAPNNNNLAQIPYVPGSGSDVALLVMIDFTKSSEKLFNAVIDYVVNISEYVSKAKIGIVMISCPSKTLLDMGIYSGPEIRSKVIAPTEPLKEKGTAQALELGKKILESETREHKMILIMSDGGNSTCLKDKPNEDEITLAELLRNLGIKIVYSIVGDNPNKDNIDRITGDPKLVITLGDLVKLLEELKKVHELFDKTSKAATSSSTTTTAPSITAVPVVPRNPVIQLPTIPGNGADMSVLFIVDFTKSCESQFEDEIDYVVEMARKMEEARIGVVSIGCPSEILLAMGTYRVFQIRRKVSPPDNPSDEKGTAQALYLAKDLLSKETTSYKLVILISDGGETTCSKNKPSVDEVALAEELRRMGITFYYPTIGPNPNRNRIQSITGDPSLIFLLSEMNQLLQELKKALELLAKTSKATTRTATTATTSTSITTRTTRKTIQLPSIPRSGADTSIVFIIDFTESVESYFDAAIDYVIDVVAEMDEARIGAVSIDCPSEVLMEMGSYTQPRIRRKLSPPSRPTDKKGTAQAFNLARKLLAKEKTAYKFLIVISDGERTTCTRNKPSDDEIDIAEKLRRMGVTIFYTAIGANPNRYRIKRITGDDSLISSLDGLRELMEMLVEYLNKRPRKPKPSTICSTVTTSKAVLFLLDQTSTVGKDGLEQEKKFMAGLLDIATDLRAGAVIIACPSYKGLPMKDYTAEEVKNWANNREMKVSSNGAMFTATYDAYVLGKTMLDEDDSDSKAVVVMSDGQSSNCKDSQEIGDFSEYAHKEFAIAREWRQAGIKIIYVQVGRKDQQFESNVEEIAGNSGNIFKVDDFDKVDKDFLSGVAKRICKEEEF